MAQKKRKIKTRGARPQTVKPKAPPVNWIASLAQLAKGTLQNPECRMRTMISCDILSGKASIYVPPDMAELQPDSLRYLHAFARQHDLQLVEDRRRVSVQPINEKRASTSPVIAIAISELLQQLGMPGEARGLSRPHRLSAESQHIHINTLICMAAFAEPKAKRVLVQPNRRMIDVLDNNNQPIIAYASKLTTTNTSTVLSHFVSPHFRAIGYSAGKQYIVHVCVAGGPLSNSELWTNFRTLTRTDFQFQLFNTKDKAADLGLFYATFYLDLAEAPAPWWLNTWADTRLASELHIEPVAIKRAS